MNIKIFTLLTLGILFSTLASGQPLSGSPLPDTITYYKQYREIYEFNPDSTIKEFTVFWYFPENAPYTRFAYRNRNVYTSDRKLKEVYWSNTEGDQSGQLITSFQYTTQGLDSIITKYNTVFNSWHGNKIISHQYDSKNRLINKTETNTNAAATYPVSIETWSYNSNDQLELQATETYSNDNGELLDKAKTTYMYDASGLKERITKYWDLTTNDWVNNLKYEYTYPNGDNLTYIEQWFNFNPQTQMWNKLNARKEFYFEEFKTTETFRQRNDYYDYRYTKRYNPNKQLISDERDEYCKTLGIYKIRDRKETTYNTDGSISLYSEYVGNGCENVDTMLTFRTNISYGYRKPIEIPSCTNILSPLNGQQNIENSATVIWNPVPAATGYKLTVKNSNGNIILIEDVGNVNQYLLNNLPPNRDICVSVNPYIVAGYENNTCDVICFKTKNVVPNCTAITSPTHGQINAATNMTITWQPTSNVQGYRITVKTPTTTIIDKMDVGNVNVYSVSNLPNNTLICVEVIPYNEVGASINCSTICFTTKNVVPNCTTITSPSQGETNTPTDISISWQPTTNVQGYRVSVKTPTATIVDKMDVGNVNVYSVSNLPNNTQICVEVIPYNEVGESINCSTICFTTKMLSSINEIISKNIHIYPNPSSESITITLPDDLQVSNATLYNTIGEQVNQYIPSSTTLIIEKQTKPAGIYYLKLTTNEGIVTKPIVFLE